MDRLTETFAHQDRRSGRGRFVPPPELIHVGGEAKAAVKLQDVHPQEPWQQRCIDESKLVAHEEGADGVDLLLQERELREQSIRRLLL
jgi:hypothetical protein